MNEPVSSASEPPHTLRVWFDSISGLWCCTRWDSVGGVARGKTLFSGSPRIHTVGPDLIFTHAVLRIEGITAAGDFDAIGDVLKIDNPDKADPNNPPSGLAKYRVNWDKVASMWVCRPLNSPGSACAPRLISTDRVESHGPFLLFREAEAKSGTQSWLQNGDMDCGDVLRIMPKSQFVDIPVMASTGRMQLPGGR